MNLIRTYINSIFILVALASSVGYGQKSPTQLKGKIINSNIEVSNVLIINLNSKKSTITDSLGFFTIEAKVKDVIRISSLQYLPKEILVTDTIFDQNSIEVSLLENVINLSEVIVTPYNLTGKLNLDIGRLNIESAVTSSSLGLPNADLEVMTQSERLLLEADRGKYVRLATMEDQGRIFEILGYVAPTIIINTHKIMNRVSGRTKSLKEMVDRDKSMELEQKIIALFPKETMSISFDIPENHMEGFLTYCLSQPDFTELSEVGSTTEIWKYLKEKSIEFKEIEINIAH